MAMRRFILTAAMFCAIATAIQPSLAEVPATRPAGAASTGSDLLTGEQVHQLADAGQYQDALKALIRILNLAGPAAAPYDREDMLMLKAECQLQIKQSPSAIGTLEIAKKEAEAANKPDDAIKAEALADLIQKSPAGIYTPKTVAIKTPIKILDKANRKAAFDALFADELALAQAKTKAAENGKDPQLYAEAAKLAGGMRSAEYGSTGATKQSDDMMKDLADHAIKMVDARLTELSTKVDKISEEANRVITVPVTMSDGYGRSFQSQQSRKQGLTGTDAQDLQNIETNCKNIRPILGNFAKLFPADVEKFKTEATKAIDLEKKANTARTANYLTI